MMLVRFQPRAQALRAGTLSLGAQKTKSKTSVEIFGGVTIVQW
ncbi:MAG: hypothetical protein WBC29_03725 [Candidatus Moraniibacteriota bacterium]